MNVLCVGYGKMGSVVANLIQNNHSLNANIYVVNTKRNDILSCNLKSFDLVCLFTKPQHTKEIIESLNINSFCNDETIFLSILAGKNYNFVSQALGITDVKYIRAMPNLGLDVKQGITSMFFKNLSLDEQEVFIKIFKTGGEVIKVEDEDQIDTLTACFGCGIGFGSFIFDTLEQSINTFLKQNAITNLNSQNLTKIMLNSLSTISQAGGFSFKDFSSSVASKGGATEAGYLSLSKNDALQNLFTSALNAALNKSIDLKNSAS
jgi:pyrroline-5-carboxylate reductase